MDRVISVVLFRSGADLNKHFIVSIGISIVEMKTFTVLEEWMYYLQPPSENHVFDLSYMDGFWETSKGKEIRELHAFRPVNPWWVMHVIEDMIERHVTVKTKLVIDFIDHLWFIHYIKTYGLPIRSSDMVRDAIIVAHYHSISATSWIGQMFDSFDLAKLATLIATYLVPINI